jgi:hypothetical protein
MKNEDVPSVVDTLAGCFNAHGLIDRAVFLRNTRILAPHHERIFYLLLHRLKTDVTRRNRLSILDAVPLMYNDVPGPRTSIQILLKEFCTLAGDVQHCDRNLLMLASKLLRHYRKEDGKNIEQTPLEVLHVQRGLHVDTVKLAQEMASELRNKIHRKRATLHASLIKSLSDTTAKESTAFTPRFLLSLSREFYILMGLIGGSDAKQIVWEGALAVSTPKSKLYHQPRSKTYSENIFGLLRVIVRSCLRLFSSDAEDRRKLRILEDRLLAFLSSVEDASEQVHLRQVVRLMEEHS